MPLRLSPGDRKILLIAGVVFGVLIAAAIFLAAPGDSGEKMPTTYSADSNGAKAAFMLLQQTGYRVERWEQPPTEIETGKNAVFILIEPSLYGNKTEREALRKFVGDGGRLLAAGKAAGWMMPQEPSIDDNPVDSLIWNPYPALAPSAIARAAPQITLAPAVLWKSHLSALALYGTEGKTVAVTYLYGKGKVIWLASATPLTNAGLKEPGNLEFLLACLGDKGDARIFWDEYYHGYKRSGNATYDTMLAGGMLAQLLLLGAAVLLTFSRRSGPLRPSIPEVRLSPLEFVETLGGLYHRANASAVAVDICYRRFLYWLAKRLGMSASASIEELERAARNRCQLQDEQFIPILRACASARYHPYLRPRRALQLVRALHSYAATLNLFSSSAKEKR